MNTRLFNCLKFLWTIVFELNFSFVREISRATSLSGSCWRTAGIMSVMAVADLAVNILVICRFEVQRDVIILVALHQRHVLVWFTQYIVFTRQRVDVTFF